MLNDARILSGNSSTESLFLCIDTTAKIISRVLEDGLWRIEHNEEILQHNVHLFFYDSLFHCSDFSGEIRVSIGYVITSQYKQ